jgi:hypothetical protein
VFHRADSMCGIMIVGDEHIRNLFWPIVSVC